jgi:dUTP pyrophosphatase
MEKEITVFVKKLDENAVIPSYAHEGDVGMDITAIGVEYDEEKDMYIYHTGLSFESDFNIGDFIFVRSSNRKTDAYLCNHVGIVDSAIYRGEVMICMKNRDSLETNTEINALKSFMDALCIVSRCDPNMNLKDATESAFEVYKLTKEDYLERARNLEFAPYKVGEKIAQMVCLKYPTVKLVEKNELSETERGEGGFGSTDKK